MFQSCFSQAFHVRGCASSLLHCRVNSISPHLLAAPQHKHRLFATKKQTEKNSASDKIAAPRKKLPAANPLSVVSVHGAKSDHVRILFQCITPRRAQLLTAVCTSQLVSFGLVSLLDFNLEVQHQMGLGFLNYSIGGMLFAGCVMFPLSHLLLSRYICEIAMMSPTTVRISTYNLLGRPKYFTTSTNNIAEMKLTEESVMKSQFWLMNVRNRKGFFLMDKARGVVYDYAFLSNMVGYTITHEQQKLASGYTPPPALEDGKSENLPKGPQ